MLSVIMLNLTDKPYIYAKGLYAECLGAQIDPYNWLKSLFIWF